MASPVRRLLVPMLRSRRTYALVNTRTMASITCAGHLCPSGKVHAHQPRRFPTWLTTAERRSPRPNPIILRATSSAAQTPGPTSASGSAVRKMTPEEGALSLRMVAETLESPELDDAVQTFATDGATESLPTDRERLFQLIHAWQRALSLAQGVQMEAISRFGFAPSPAGLLSYEQQLAKLVAAAQTASGADELTALRRRKWAAVLSRCFDVRDDPAAAAAAMSLDEARRATAALADAVRDAAFVERLRGKMDAMATSSSSSAGERRVAVVEEVLAAHGRVLERLGFGGERGYVRFQAAVTDHVIDADVAANLAAATSSVLKLAER